MQGQGMAAGGTQGGKGRCRHRVMQTLLPLLRLTHTDRG